MRMFINYFEYPKDKPRINKFKKVHSLKEAEAITTTIIQGTFTNPLPFDGGQIIIKP